jgi:hypothetical protein
VKSNVLSFVLHSDSFLRTGGVQIVDVGYNYPRDTPPNTFTIDTQYGGGPLLPVA